MAEAERNIAKKLDQAYLSRHHQALLDLEPEIVEVDKISLSKLYQLSQLLPSKDIPVFVNVIKSKARYFITLDKKHFLNNDKLKAFYPKIKITNPSEFLKDLTLR